MKNRGIFALVILGLLSLVQGGIIAAQSPMGEAPPGVDARRMYVLDVRISQYVTGLSRSLFGCLACWLLALYLRTRRLEQEINARLGELAPPKVPQSELNRDE